MGNADLIIIINGYKVFEIMGTEYEGNGYDEVIKMVIEKFNQHINEMKELADKPEEIDEVVKKIEVFEK